MGIGRKQEVSIALIPEDAEDINSVEWSVDNADGLKGKSRWGYYSIKGWCCNNHCKQQPKHLSSVSVKVLPNIKEYCIHCYTKSFICWSNRVYFGFG